MEINIMVDFLIGMFIGLVIVVNIGSAMFANSIKDALLNLIVVLVCGAILFII